jgi:hypothetical protein
MTLFSTFFIRALLFLTVIRNDSAPAEGRFLRTR